MGRTASFIMFFIGIFFFGIVFFPLGMYFANQGSRNGENTALPGTLNFIGLLINFVFILILFAL